MAGDSEAPSELEETPYGYIPTQYVCILFLALFVVSTVVHSVQSTYYRMWWLLPTASLCGVLEVIGWGSRLWSSYSPLTAAPFETQITATIIAPTLLAAVNFFVMRHIVMVLGPAYSRLSPKQYPIIFGLNLISFVILAIGGGIASISTANHEDPKGGGQIMLGGIIVHIISILLYVACTLEFFVRYFRDKPLKQVTLENSTAMRGFMSRRIQIVCIALTFSTICLFIRAVYRTAELSDGWEGTIFRTEIWFSIFDGAMVVLAMFSLHIAHPGLIMSSAEARGKGRYSLPLGMHAPRPSAGSLP